MPSVVRFISEAEASAELKPLYAMVKASYGNVPNTVKVLAHDPFLLGASMKAKAALSQGAPLPGNQRDFVLFAVAQEHSCTYCIGMSKMWLRLTGYSERVIDSIKRQMEAAEFDTSTQVLLSYVRLLARSPELVGPTDVAKVRSAGFKDPEIVTASGLVADAGFNTRCATGLDVDVEGMMDAVNSTVGRIALVPVLRFMLKRKAAKSDGSGASAGPAPEAQAVLSQISRHPLIGCCPAVFESLSSHPCALDAVWLKYQRTLEQGALQPVSKAYLGLIVAEGLGSPDLKELQFMVLERLGRSREQVQTELKRLSPSIPDVRGPQLVELARAAARPGEADQLRGMGHKLKAEGASDRETVEAVFTAAAFFEFATLANALAAMRTVQ